jgi:hypothetical protein
MANRKAAVAMMSSVFAGLTGSTPLADFETTSLSLRCGPLECFDLVDVIGERPGHIVEDRRQVRRCLRRAAAVGLELAFQGRRSLLVQKSYALLQDYCPECRQLHPFVHRALREIVIGNLHGNDGQTRPDLRPGRSKAVA